MTNTQALIKIGKALVKQGEPSIDEESGDCVYENEHGLRCAVGVMIPKGYRFSEGWAILTVLNQIKEEHKRKEFAKGEVIRKPPILGLNIRVLKEAQSIHDNGDYSGMGWVDRIKNTFLNKDSKIRKCAKDIDNGKEPY